MTHEQSPDQVTTRSRDRADSETTELSHEHVAVVVVMYNSRPLLSSFVAALDAGLDGVEFELVAVDNASPDGSAEHMATIAPTATIVRTGRNGGYAAGINAGVAAAARHTAVLVLNSDVRLGQGCVAELLPKLRQPGIGVVVPRLVDGDGEVIHSMRREPTIARAFGAAVLGAERAGRFEVIGEVVTERSQYDREQITDWAEGSTQLISAECWDACGPWDDSFFLYSEETDYDLRARDLGFATLFVSTAHAVHLEGGSGISDHLWRLQVLNRIKFYRTRHGRAATALFWLATLLREGTRAALGRSNSRTAVRALMNPQSLRERPGPEHGATQEAQDE